MVASALAKHLDAEVAEIPSEKNRGIFTIIGEQWFWGDDRQKPFEKNLQDYSPIIVVAPIYLMQLSAPGRFFIEEVIPDGSDVYVFTTSGGPLAGFTQKGIEELITDSGLIAKGVYGFQAGKTQEEFDSLVCEFLKEHQLIGAPGECALQTKSLPATQRRVHNAYKNKPVVFGYPADSSLCGKPQRGNLESGAGQNSRYVFFSNRQHTLSM